MFAGGTTMAAPTKEIRTYVSLTRPFDPAYIRTLADLNMSYALSSTLVTWSSDRQPVSLLAKSWKIESEKVITFELSPQAKWSDGKQITSEEFKASLDRAKSLHGDALKSLFDVVEKIETPNTSSLRFSLTLPVDKSQILKKLTEPMYGAVKIKGDKLDLSVTSGPFFLKSDKENETVLQKNESWIKASPALAQSVVIRPVPKDKSVAESFLRDDWANLVETSSLVTADISRAIKNSGVGIWSHNLDKAFVIGLSPKHFNEQGFQFLRYLGQNMQKDAVLQSLTGATKADQFFPKGYALYSSEFSLPKEKQSLPKAFSSQPLVVLIPRERVNPQLQKNIAEALKKALNTAVQFKDVSISEMEQARKEGSYDVYAVSLAVTDPNYEGSMAFWFDMNPAFIPSGKGSLDYQARVAKIRQLGSPDAKVLEARKIMTEAVATGSILPLFHFSTVGLAKRGINLSAVPTTDETISFEKVTFE
jgi:ABC-type transport system substrate-binding protein